MTLEAFFAENPAAALAFSGGTDSAYLLYEACRCGARVRAYFVKSPFQPAFELADAKRFAREVGCELTVLPMDILADAAVAENPPERCYHCKTAIFTLLRRQAAADGFTLLLDGTNASDDAADRPGMRALRELAVRSPLRECGVTKAMVRQRSRAAGLFTWDKPSYSCLATRVAAGEVLTAEKLARIEWGEEFLSSLGFSDFRLRTAGDTARIQVTADQQEQAWRQRAKIEKTLRQRFAVVTLDLTAREAAL